MTTYNTQELDEWDEDELLQHLVVYMSFYVEARDAKSVEDMGKWIHKIFSMITGAYSDGFQKASKGAFKSQQEAKKNGFYMAAGLFGLDISRVEELWDKCELKAQQEEL